MIEEIEWPEGSWMHKSYLAGAGARESQRLHREAMKDADYLFDDQSDDDSMCPSVHEGVKCEGHTWHAAGFHFSKTRLWTDTPEGTIDLPMNGVCGNY